jgi:hypothetical protein
VLVKGKEEMTESFNTASKSAAQAKALEILLQLAGSASIQAGQAALVVAAFATVQDLRAELLAATPEPVPTPASA